ncbi:hypothetical protein, partial [Streptomyces sp. bgisy093]
MSTLQQPSRTPDQATSQDWPAEPPAVEGPPLLSLRSAFVLTAAVLVGIGVGLLTCAAEPNTAAAVLAGVAAFGVSASGLHKLIG